METSIITILAEASIVVQGVVAILLIMSLASWYVIVERSIMLRRAFNADRDFEEDLWAGGDLSDLYTQVKSDEHHIGTAQTAFVAGYAEFERQHKDQTETQLMLDAVQRRLRIWLSRREGELSQPLPFLAIVASSSPYIGLFGTVWGIMGAFQGLSNAAQATLASVAPGISEALVATAVGLFAAIPAVIGYNRLTAKVNDIMTEAWAFADELTALLTRHHDTIRRVREASAAKASAEAEAKSP